MLARMGLSLLVLVFSSTTLAEMIAKEYPVKDFSEFVVSGETELEVSQTGKEYLKIEADSEIMKHVKVDQTGKRVSVWAKKDGDFFRWFSNNDSMKIKVTLQVKNLEYLELSGASTADVKDLKTTKLDLSASGAANGRFSNLNADYLDADLSGASNLQFETMNSLQQNFELSGASNLEVKSASRTDKLVLGASGASNVRAKKLIAKQATIGASGASHIDVSVTEDLNAEASGASGITYHGNPKARTDASGASHISANN
jgi:Putative auto-transporter adhesin, head GIN domain